MLGSGLGQDVAFFNIVYPNYHGMKYVVTAF